MLNKLNELTSRRGKRPGGPAYPSQKGILQRFLAVRCSKEFLELFLTQDPDLVIRVSKPGRMLDAVSEVPLALRLHEFGLLPEAQRVKFVETVSSYAIEGRDPGAITDGDIQAMFSSDEFQVLVQRIKAELLPRLEEVRQEWEEDYSSDGFANGHMEPLMELLDGLKFLFKNEVEELRKIEDEESEVEYWIGENSVEEPDRDDWDFQQLERQEKTSGDRSIFDDIDDSEDE